MPSRSICAPARNRTGLTLVELIVVLAVIVVFALFLLPAMNAVREAARRTQCTHNLRDIVLATVNYESQHGSFPPALPSCSAEAYQSTGTQLGNRCAGPNWATQILALMNEKQLHEDLASCMELRWQACDDCEYESGVGRTTPTYMRCPSAPIPSKLHQSQTTTLERLSKGNYVACLGSEHYLTAIEGNAAIEHDRDDALQVGVMTIKMIPGYEKLPAELSHSRLTGNWKFALGHGTKMRQISDGTSKTIVLCELLTWDGASPNARFSDDIRGAWTCASMGASTYSHKYGPNSTVNDRVNACGTDIDDSSALNCEQAEIIGPQAAETWASARSMHSGGVVAAHADGSIKFYDNGIHLPLWRALATRAGSD